MRVNYFFYGTLIDPEVLRLILGREVAPLSRRKARLRGYRRVFRHNATYPVLVADADAAVEGVVIGGLAPRDVAALERYEGPDYKTITLPMALANGGEVVARVFVPARTCAPSAIDWTFEEWRRRFRGAHLRRISRPRRAPSAATGRSRPN